MKAIAVLIIALCFAGCQQSNSEIVAARQWKHGEGFGIGDWLVFSNDKNGGLYISNDTIYKEAKPAALIGETEYNVDHYILTIHSLDHKQSGLYFDKGRSE